MLALLALHVAYSFLPALREIRNDFANYYVPARMLTEGRSVDRLYERDAFQAEVRRAGLGQLASFIPHPPPNALLLLPFGGLEPPSAKAAWTVVLALAYAATLPVLRAATGLSGWWLALVLLLPSTSLQSAIAYGQPYPLLLLLLSLALVALERGGGATGGALLAPAFALKLYAAPHLALLLLSRRLGAAAGFLAALLAVFAVSVAVLGIPVHAAYWREILPRSLSGDIQDPYSPLWGSFASLAHRLFRAEADLNPLPALERPEWVAPGARAAAVLVLLLAVAARPVVAAPLRRHWAIVTLAALAASPLTQSYHFVLLVLPVALLLAERPAPLQAASLLLLLAFATSPLPHYFQRFAHGWANLLAYPRLGAVLLLLLYALRGTLSSRRAAVCMALAALLGLLSASRGSAPRDWTRIEAARGYLAAAPVECERGIAWLSIEGGAYVIRHSDGRVRRADDGGLPACAGGSLSARPAADADSDAAGSVYAESGRLLARDRDGRERELAQGRFRRPRLSPDGQRVAVESWEEGSWDLRLVSRDGSGSRRVTSDPANEVEPAWASDGASLLFASDRGRGLGSTALYRIPVR